MKLLIVTPKYYPDTFPINLVAEELVQKGHDVHVLTSVPFVNGKYIKKYDKSCTIENGVTVYRVKAAIRTNSKSSLIKNYLSLTKEMRKWARNTSNLYDMVYTYSISPVTILGAGNIYKKKYGIKHFAHVLDLWPEAAVDAGYVKRGLFMYRVLFHWSKKEYRKLDKLFTGTKAYKDYLVKRMKIKESKISYFPQPGLVYEDKRGNNPYDTNKTNIVYCGNISTLQLVDYIVPAMKEINNENIVFNIVGTGAYLEDLKKQISDSGLTNVIYHGYFNYQESAKYIMYADAICVSLKNRGITGKTLPNKLVSSLFYSKPIIGMIEGEGKDILKDNGNIIATESVEGLKKAINDFLKLSKVERKEIGNKNRQTYDDNYSTDKFSKKLLSSFSRK